MAAIGLNQVATFQIFWEFEAKPTSLLAGGLVLIDITT